MNSLITQSFGALSTRFAEMPVENTLASGVPASFGVIGFKGKVWSVRYRGNTTHLLAENGRDPAFSIEVCIFKSSQFVSKTFYERAYVEGSNDPPDCMSMNGIVPEANVPKRQAPACATCPNNQWGSRLTPDGKPAKACSDNKRLAVGLMPNLYDDTFGGPLLLRVPPTSLQDMASYGNLLAQHSFPENALVTRVSFDMREAYPRFNFAPVRPLTDGEAEASIYWRASPEVGRILSEALEYGQEPGQPQAEPQVEPQPEIRVNPENRQPPPTSAVPSGGASGGEQPAPRPATAPQPMGVGQRAVAARASAGPTPPRSGVVRTLTLPSTPVQPQQQPQQQTAQQQAVPASSPASGPGAVPASDDGIPAFLRRAQGGAPESPADSVGDDALMDAIDAKLAAMLPS